MARWWLVTEILAPYLKRKGKLIAAQYDEEDSQAGYRANARQNFDKKMASNKKVYGEVNTASLMFDEAKGILVKGAAQSNSVDRVVTFRNAHGMYARGVIDAAMTHFFDVLKPGGKLGIVQHMASENQDWRSKNIGYVGRETLIATALKAGFVLEAEGFFNRNPKDSTHYSQGVWQLPPSLRGSNTPEDKAPYIAVGESNRMSLVFVKPE